MKLPEEILRYEEAVDAYAKYVGKFLKWDEAYGKLDVLTKTKFAEAYAKSQETSVEGRKTMACADPDYVEHITAVETLRAEREKWRKSVDVQEKKVELYRSAQSFIKKQMELV